MTSSFERQIITEKYIIKLKELSSSFNNNYIKNRFGLIIKYMNGDNMFDNIPLSETYFNQINESKEIPFLIKSDLYSELSFLDSLNQGSLLKIIKKLKTQYNKEIKNESDERRNMDDGQIIERNQNMLELFIKEFGYNPIHNSIISNNIHNDGFNDLELSETEEVNNEAENNVIEETKTKKQSSVVEKQKNVSSTSSTSSIINNDVSEKMLDQNGSLETLNQLFDIMTIDFNEVLNDIIPDPDTPPVFSPMEAIRRKPKLTKAQQKKLDEEKSKAIENPGIHPELSYKDYKIKIEKLVSNAVKLSAKTVLETDKYLGIKSVLEIADNYKTGKILVKSTIKANMMYIFLIKKYNNVEAMYLLGEELLNGTTILKNQTQGTKLIKSAAEDYKFPAAIAKFKTLSRTKVLNKRDKYDSD
jgi:hypothetical protein